MLNRFFITRDTAYKSMTKQFEMLNRPEETFNVLCEEDSLRIIQKYIRDDKGDISIDIETTCTDPYCGNILLTTVTLDNQVSITFDNLTITPQEMLAGLGLENKTLIMHNAMFEISWFMVHGYDYRNLFCTMIAEQKIFQGIDEYSYSITNVLKRRGLELPEDMDKDVRMDFINNYSRHELKHVLYNQADTLPLHELKRRQQTLIDACELNFYLKNIHFPLIRVLSKAQLEGLVIDEKQFVALAKEAELKMQVLEANMNSWIKTEFPATDMVNLNKPLAESLQKTAARLTRNKDRVVKLTALLEKYRLTNKTHLKAYNISENSLKLCQEDILLTEEVLKNLQLQTSIAWSSSAQVLGLLSALNCSPLPTGKDPKTNKYKPSLGKAARERWLLKYKTHKLHYLLNSFDEYMKLIKHVSSFGESFLEKYKHPVTGKYHTSYKQGTVATGRLASGDSNGNPPKFNSQQIIAVKAIRNCFGTDPGYKIATVDLTGAELIVMCSLANDMNLFKLSTGDMHSYFANKGWKAIYEARKQPWTEADVISKAQNKDKRTDYKPMLFGTVYGLKAPKAAETLNITEAEGQIAINTIMQEIPDTIKMVQEAVKFARKHGYVIHNERTKSRRWFYAIILHNEDGNSGELSYLERKDVEGGARNTRIQGTQADMLCEAMVTLQRFIDLYKLDAALLMQVHDELVVKFKEEYQDWFPQRIGDIMSRTANKYLHPEIKMRADVQYGDSWTK